MSKGLALVLVLVFLAASIVVVKPVSSASAMENSWTKKVSMPSLYGSAGNEVAVVKGTVYIFGVPTNLITKMSNYAYDPRTDTWTEITPMPTPRVSFSVATYDNKIYVMGGFEINAATSCSVNEVYNPSTDTWSTAASMPISTAEAQADTVDGKIYVMGGTGGPAYTTVNETQIYEPTTDSWSIGVSMPYPVTMASSAVVDAAIYVFGGVDEYLGSQQNTAARFLHTTQIFNTVTNTWSLGAPYSGVGTDQGAGATVGVMAPKQICVFGGFPSGPITIGASSNVVSVYNPASNSWATGAHMPYPAAGPAVAVVNDVFYVIGGGQGSVANEQYTPIGYGTPDPSYVLEHVPANVSLISPLNQTYNDSAVPLVLTLDKPVIWICYSLDEKQNVTVTGNSTISGLTSGLHNVTVYVEDAFGNESASETMAFTVNLEPFPTTIVATASAASVGIIGIGSLIYFKRHKH
jgi:N-acetylneuraminic acid mutarotase